MCPYGATAFAPRRPLGVAWARVREPPTGVLMTLLRVPTGLLHSLLGCSSEPLEGACGGLLGGSVASLQCLDLALVTVLGCLGSRVFVPLMIVLSEFSFTCIGINGKAASAVSTVCLFNACLCLTIVMLGQ
jgi:hypothetical protein